MMKEVKVDEMALGILKIIIASIVVGVSAYWASWVTEGASKANINEAVICQLTRSIDTMKIDLKEDMSEIKKKLDQLSHR